MKFKILAFLYFLLLGVPALADERPNILWLTVEDISPLIGAYGYDDISTPNIDALAKEGVLYSNAYVTAPVCAVMRSALLTGIFSSSQGTQHMRNEAILSPEIKTYPKLMIEAGYYATNPGKTDYQGLAAKEIWNSSPANYQSRPDKSKPFMHVINHRGTHESQASDDPGRYDIAKLSSFPPYYPDTEKARRVWASHLQQISEMDGWVGEQLAELEASGEAENTIVFFYSDHGSGLPRGKRWAYDSGLKIPLIVRMPDKWKHLMPNAAGSQTDELISTIDLTATVLNLAGVPTPEYMQGRAFLGENLPPERSYIHAHRDRMDERYELIRAVKDKRFKYIRNYEYWKPHLQFNQYAELNKWSGIMEEIRRVYAEPNPPAVIEWFFETKPVEELYDTQNDPHELVNLASDPNYAAKLAELRAEAVRWRKSSRDLGVIPEQILLDRRGQEGEYSYGLHNQASIERAWEVLDNLHKLSAEELIAMMADDDAVIRY
ncbi:MAG: sulfatase [Proteobacteria bacterium]|nr:sulfatase [Pseudomonadota bacterium]